MQKTDKQLDLLFKEGLEDAGVKAPRGAWKAVCAALDAQAAASAGATGAFGASASRRKVSPFAWGTPLVAFAAAAVAALVVVGTNEKTIIEGNEAAFSVVEDNSGVLAQAIEPVAPAASAAASAAAGEKASYVPRSVTEFKVEEVLPEPLPETPVVTPSAASEEAVAPETEVAVEATESVEVAPQPSEPVAPQTISDEKWVDPFAAMEAEDAAAAAKARRSGSRLALAAGGIVGANDAHFNNGPSRPLYSSGLYSDGAVEETSVSAYGIPFSMGLGARYHLTDKLSIGLGANVTMLTRTFAGSYKTAEGQFTHNMQYVGIPLSLSYDLVKAESLVVYAWGGASAEKCLSSNYYIYADSPAPIYTDSVKSLQYGLFGGVGVEFKITDKLGLYLDPSVRYYLPGNQPKSIRTDKPLMVSFEAGLRFNL